MALRSFQMPPINSIDQLAKLLQDFNEDIDTSEIQGVVLGTTGDDAGKNLIVVDDEKEEARVPFPREFSGSFSKLELAEDIAKVERQDGLRVRRFGKLIIDEEEVWVALFDPVPALEQNDATPSFEPFEGTFSGAITNDHWLDSAQRKIIGEGSEISPLFIVIHYTEGFTASSSVSGWRTKNNGILAHVVVDRDGSIIQCRPFIQRCGHAGESRSRHPQTGKLHQGLNSNSIGIEIANTGSARNLHQRLSTHAPGAKIIEATHRNESVPNSLAANQKRTQWEAFPGAQLASVFGLVSTLMSKYGIVDITGHDCIAMERKTDPGPAFPMADLRRTHGLSGLPPVFDRIGHQIDI